MVAFSGLSLSVEFRVKYMVWMYSESDSDHVCLRGRCMEIAEIGLCSSFQRCNFIPCALKASQKNLWPISLNFETSVDSINYIRRDPTNLPFIQLDKRGHGTLQKAKQPPLLTTECLNSRSRDNLPHKPVCIVDRVYSTSHNSAYHLVILDIFSIWKQSGNLCLRNTGNDSDICLRNTFIHLFKKEDPQFGRY